MPSPLIDPRHAETARSMAPLLRAVAAYTEALTAFEAARALGITPSSRAAVEAAEATLAAALREARARADLVGRADVIEAARSVGVSTLAPIPEAIEVEAALNALPRVPFLEASADVLAREPILARAAVDVATAYDARHGFAALRASQPTVTERVQLAVSKAIRTGERKSDTAAEIRRVARLAGEDMADWTDAYAQTVVRTNVNTAYSAGRFRQMSDPDIRQVIGALRYTAVGDHNTRPNHLAADGLVASVDDPIWQSLAPPLGFQCRCRVDFVTRSQLARMGYSEGVPPAAHPSGAYADVGFRHSGRPDILIYGGAA